MTQKRQLQLVHQRFLISKYSLAGFAKAATAATGNSQVLGRSGLDNKMTAKQVDKYHFATCDGAFFHKCYQIKQQNMRA